jgi:predicted transcriptional regulator
MTTKKKHEMLPRAADELAALADYYDNHDTSGQMDAGRWVDPRPMQTTSLRLPVEVVDALKALAQTRNMRYTALVRDIVEHALHDSRSGEADRLLEINERLARIEAAVVSPRKPSHPSRKRVETPRRGRRAS